MIEPINHYSLQNVPTVYDEEALTVLELVGRLADKVNKVIHTVNGINIPDIVEVAPSGDTSGDIDRVTIQAQLDAGKAVHLTSGEYYLDGPLVAKSGFAITGAGIGNTKVNCAGPFLTHENVVSVDHMVMANLWAKGPGSGTGVDITRAGQNVDTGGRYGYFENVRVSDYDTCVHMTGCWCVHFTHCRFEPLYIGVNQGGSCNNVKYDHCMFLGINSAQNTTGLYIDANGGTENCGISVDNCDFERHNRAIRATYAINLHVTNIYTEGCSVVFHLDSCPAFLCDGGYMAYPSRVCNTARSNTSPAFSKCSGAIKNVFVKVNSDERWFFTSTASAFPIACEAITCVNDGGGECITDAQHTSSIFNAMDNFKRFVFVKEGVNLRYSDTLYTNRFNELSPYISGEEYKLTTAKLKLTSDVTPTKATAIQIRVNDNPVFVVYLNADQTYTNGTWLDMTCVATDYRDLIFTRNDYMTKFVIAPTVGDYASACTANVICDVIAGNFVL